MHNHRAATAPLALSAAAVLLLSACGGDGDNGASEGIGDTSVFNNLEVSAPGDGEVPEVTIYEELEGEDNASQVLNQGSGEQLTSDWLIDYHLTVVDPEDATVLQSTHEEPIDPFLSLPALSASQSQTEQFFAEGLTAEGVTVGSEVVFYVTANPAEGVNADTLYIFEILDQSPTYADGEEQEQSGDLPGIDSEIGTAPELGDHDPESQPPEELSSEVLVAGEGEEIGDEDYVFAQYRGWRWEDGEIFDQSWTEDGAPGNPFDFSLEGGVIPGWLEGIPGHHVGDRILLVIPPEQAYGETADEEEGTSADGGPGGTLIFVVDIVRVIDGETMAEMQAASQQQQQQAPQMELSEEEREQLEGLSEEHGISVEELEMFLQMGIPMEELETILQAEDPDGEDSGEEAEQDPDEDDQSDEDED
ncbi:FKBP-type peptidyl-prolyl cis-trans isomerase [Nesterenkonia alkaliphila]|uniref:peptidylprolyl isomerase n=1 Tax=Nesterenkonia alkaliphila TaxID=1463631 RepID=A0A7K1UM83_9MICC|nr:FKBP-type peptidyl-prolyl cis-trans isomerase [Nesterenkonia alkaliphila]MVT27580.1 hypothetical protein [Nesterenkonia alkaliphila]GFZ79898.1 peptidylprolyl isomerase [Nesterenkonia alkaliphila]